MKYSLDWTSFSSWQQKRLSTTLELARQVFRYYRPTLPFSRNVSFVNYSDDEGWPPSMKRHSATYWRSQNSDFGAIFLNAETFASIAIRLDRRFPPRMSLRRYVVETMKHELAHANLNEQKVSHGAKWQNELRRLLKDGKFCRFSQAEI